VTAEELGEDEEMRRRIIESDLKATSAMVYS